MVGRGGVTDFDGDLDDYQRYLLDEAKRLRELVKEEARSATPAVAIAPPAPAPNKTQRNKPLQKELADIESQIATLNTEKTTLEAALLKPADAQAMAQSGKRLKAIGQMLEGLDERWLGVTEQMEGV
jgi:ATP-binding cassette subfamily F protein 3